MSILQRSSRRYLGRHPWQAVLVIFGVALGVAVVVAVDLASESAGRAFRLSMENLSGRATHQIVGGPSGLDERLYTRLRVEAGVRACAPVVEGYGTVGDETLHLLGIDPFAETTFRAHLEGVGDRPVRTLLTEPDTVLMAESTARRLGLRVGARFELELGGRRRTLRLAGLLHTHAGTAAAMDGLLVSDIATAQELMGYVGRLSWIDLRLPHGAAGAALKARIERLLPADATLVPAQRRTESMAQMTRAFRINLTAMSLLALLVGMFLIYNTMTFAVLQRRRLIGSLRILGVTRREVFRMVLIEALVIGLLGTGLGLLIGIVLGQGLIQLVTRTINDLYFVLTVSRLSIPPASLLKGVVLGLGATLLSALVPAIEAAWTTPRAAITRSALEGKVHALAPRLALAGAGLVLGALSLLLLPSKNIVLGFAALFMLILGLTLATPLAVLGMTRLASPLLGRLFGLQARLAVRGIADSSSRTGVAVAALMLAVSTTVGVGVMVESFRSTVAVWLGATLRADIYVSAPSLKSNRTQSHLDAGIIERIRRIPGIAGISSGRRVTVESNRGLTEVLALQPASRIPPNFLLKQGKPETVWAAFRQDRGVVVSEPYAYHNDVGVGDSIRLRTDRGMRSFAVVGIYYDYDSEHGIVLMHRSLYNRYFHDRSISALGIYVQPTTSVAEVMGAIRAAAASRHNGQRAMVRSNREIRDLSLRIFDRTFTITSVLRLLAIIVAFVGILSALTALQLERAKELAVLRATGFTPAQVRGMVTLQTGFMGLAAGVLALPTGLVLALVLIHVINRRSFGWSMQTLVSPELLLQAVLLAVVAALIAGLYPGWKMARTPPAEALREE